LARTSIKYTGLFIHDFIGFLLVRKIANSGKIHQIFYAQLKKVEKG